MSKPNSFDVMKRMSAENKDIQLYADVVSAQTAKGGGHLTMGVSAELVHAMAAGKPKYKIFLLALNEEQYNAVSEALTQNANS